jgi:SNF2 family DNA or RNA helicase
MGWPAVERQADDRAHRIRQRSAVTVYRSICENTIEERIHRILQAKQHLFDEYVDQVTIDPGRLFGEREIFGLLGLEPPPRGGGTAPDELAA